MYRKTHNWYDWIHNNQNSPVKDFFINLTYLHNHATDCIPIEHYLVKDDKATPQSTELDGASLVSKIFFFTLKLM